MTAGSQCFDTAGAALITLKFVGIENAKRRRGLKVFLVAALKLLLLVTVALGVWKAYGVERF